MVVQRYRPPACRYCAGHRGVVLGGTAGLPVRAALSGRVVYAGAVAGVRWVVAQRGDGLAVVVGRLATVLVRPGQVVEADTVVGSAGIVIYVGFRVGDRPIDPADVLAGGWNGSAQGIVSPPSLVPGDGGAIGAGAVGACRR